MAKGTRSGYRLDLHHSPDDAAPLFEAWQTALATGERYEYESRVRRHDGAWRWFLNRAEAVRAQHGQIVKWLGTSTDIHEQKLTEQLLRRFNEDLEQFAYAAGHDLQEPLRTVSIYSQLLLQRYGGHGEEAEKFARYIVGGARQMDSLLKGVMAYSRAGGGPPSASRFPRRKKDEYGTNLEIIDCGRQ